MNPSFVVLLRHSAGYHKNTLILLYINEEWDKKLQSFVNNDDLSVFLRQRPQLTGENTVFGM